MSSINPFFTIGVVTFNRREMLKECIGSILAQTYTNFEVIIGNDYTEEKLNSEELGINDQRIRFINHENNLGEIKNLNFLLNEAEGKYFTWLGDDDAYYPNFLESIHNGFITHDKLECVYSNYNFNNNFNINEYDQPSDIFMMSGSELLLKYYKKEVLLHGCYGVFEIEYLKQIGGMRQSGSGISPYSSDLIVLNSALKDQVGYLKSPPIFYRNHDKSLSIATTDIISYITSQIDLLKYAKKILSDKTLIKYRKVLIYHLTKTLIDHYFGIKCRINNGKNQGGNDCSWANYILIINKIIKSIDISQLFKINIHLMKRYLIYIIYSIEPLYNVLLFFKKNKVSN